VHEWRRRLGGATTLLGPEQCAIRRRLLIIRICVCVQSPHNGLFFLCGLGWPLRHCRNKSLSGIDMGRPVVSRRVASLLGGVYRELAATLPLTKARQFSESGEY